MKERKNWKSLAKNITKKTLKNPVAKADEANIHRILGRWPFNIIYLNLFGWDDACQLGSGVPLKVGGQFCKRFDKQRGLMSDNSLVTRLWKT